MEFLRILPIVSCWTVVVSIGQRKSTAAYSTTGLTSYKNSLVVSIRSRRTLDLLNHRDAQERYYFINLPFIENLFSERRQ